MPSFKEVNTENEFLRSRIKRLESIANARDRLVELLEEKIQSLEGEISVYRKGTSKKKPRPEHLKVVN